MTTAHSISANDQIMATLQSNGTVIAHITKSNFSSINDVVKFMSNMAEKFLGLAKLTIRNRTQGWSLNMAICKRAPLATKCATALPGFTSGQQLSIPW